MFVKGQDMSADQAMRFAIETAKLGTGFVSPNPLVGCVIVDKNHKFLSAGAHLLFGGPHAEINALAEITEPETLNGATLYVTLEPCSHQGKTGACALALAKIPFKEIYYGQVDPNPEVAGRGIEFLKINGHRVKAFGRYESELDEITEQFFYHIQNRKPFISLKVGTSLDGKIALNNGDSQWITGEDARKHARQLRGHYDATLIGGGTLAHDNPRLDFRDTGFETKKQNKIIILDPKGVEAETFKGSNLSKLHEPKNIFVLTRSEHLEKWTENLVQLVEWESSEIGWDRALKNLYNRGIASIYVEGGAYVFGQMLSHNLPQKLYMYQSAKIIGEGLSWSMHYGSNSLDSTRSLSRWSAVPLGSDYLHIGYF